MAASCFEPGAPIVVARAPGRLDVMGGIADYSGSLVLQWPIREATLVAVQAVARARTEAGQPGDRDRSRATLFELDASTTKELLEGDYDSARRWFARDPASHWAAYVVGRAGRARP